MKPLLDITDVSLSYHSLSGETPALSHISFQLMPGEFLAIVGPSGCGKSTLLNLICVCSGQNRDRFSYISPALFSEGAGFLIYENRIR